MKIKTLEELGKALGEPVKGNLNSQLDLVGVRGPKVIMFCKRNGNTYIRAINDEDNVVLLSLSYDEMLCIAKAFNKLKKEYKG